MVLCSSGPALLVQMDDVFSSAVNEAELTYFPTSPNPASDICSLYVLYHGYALAVHNTA